MKKLQLSGIAILVIILVILTGCGQQSNRETGSAVAANGGRVITDMAGRKVVVPQNIKKVYPMSPLEAVLLYTIDPDLLAGWGYHMGADQSDYILPAYRNLPVLGWINRGSTGNLEEVIKMKPDIILMADEINQANKNFADELEQLTKIPVVVLDKQMTNMAQSYEAAGTVLKREARAAELAAYCQETLGMVAEKKPLATQRKPVSVYYAEGRGGLETEPRGSWHAEIIEYVGGVNVADPGLPSSGAVGRSPVSLEQVIAWNPEVILIGYFRDGESSSYPSIMGDSAWQHIKAVQDKRVYEIPTGPFNWFDRPPAVSRLIGIRWVANLLYPDIYPFDFRAEVKRFYALFYHYQLSEKELDELAARARRK
ncbi:ABC transporter substrate-binding protein [Sporomusa acidovorans]|uniref:Fe/B12 periplasmic-binding domain-containing protein n=1 Tax=Sporomusa acidovorans (strain ATCC 49682 / DSM 3132 / Mol) TaxID=1123286 RepID=A0ABZ3J5F0_SPOA4|nr:ABC transporter substrate-binding protein [Sporomusa acidovorans]OZC15396.1 vitamin B12-binding protein [Sporomusa acidovorans DSM 3132]SDF13431.1 iron complex transport system substrate-binding protein [Sporomusa acidovorans]